MRLVRKLALTAALSVIPAIAAAAGWRMAESSGLMTRMGEYVMVGGGVTDFTDTDRQDAYDMGATWEARLGLGSRSFIGAELAYVGALRDHAEGDNDLMANGAEAVLRLQYPYVQGTWLIEPFALGGIGWSHLSVDNVTAGADSDDVGVVPVGAGLTVGYGRLLLDGRFTYRAAFSDDDLGGSLDTWSVLGSLGYEF